MNSFRTIKEINANETSSQSCQTSRLSADPDNESFTGTPRGKQETITEPDEILQPVIKIELSGV
jgi:hypothetical protein